MTDNNTRESSLLPSAKTMIRGVQFFILFSVIGILLGFWWKKPDNLIRIFSQLDWKFVALLIPLIALDHILGGFRYRLYFDGKVLPYVSLWNCMRSNYANLFLGAATPFQTGGGPAQMYILWRSGAKISDGILASLFNWVTTLLFFLASTGAAAFLLPHDLFGENLAPILRATFIVIGSVVAFALLVMFVPKLGLAAIRKFLYLFPFQHPKFLAWRQRLLQALENETLRFREMLQQILRRRTWLLGATLLATFVLFFNKYVIGYVIARSLGQAVPFGPFLGLQIMQLFMIYFAPTPGASGVAELSSVWLFERLMPQEVLLVYAVLWRLATTISGAVIGGLVMFFDVRAWHQQPLPKTPAAAAPEYKLFSETP
jgi:uncharacterized protein (TIRG00374 family)